MARPEAVVVLDSSFLVAYHNHRDVHHARAAAELDRLLSEESLLLLPEYVFLEVVTVIGLKVGMAQAKATGDALLAAIELEFVPCSDHFLDAWELFRAQADFELSFVDATVVAVAHARGARRVATFDSDYGRVAGIEVVPAD